VLVEEGMQEMRGLMEALPWHAGSLLSVTVNVIHGYRETCQAAYRGIVQPHPEDKRVCSAAWLNDEDISRFLKYVLCRLTITLHAIHCSSQI
jgi:exocyst complex component 4